MKTKKYTLTPDEIVRIWNARQSGYSLEHCGNIVGIGTGAASRWISDIQHVRGGGRANRRTGRKQLREAVKMIDFRAEMATHKAPPVSLEVETVVPPCGYHNGQGFHWQIVVAPGSVGTSNYTDIYAVCDHCLLKKKI